MQRDPHYDDVLGEVAEELAASVARARAAGVSDEQLAVDPGIGFGKRLEDNLALLARVGELRGAPGAAGPGGAVAQVLPGRLTGEPVERRDEATWAACAVAVFAGADAVRVHDVAGAARAVRDRPRDARRAREGAA